MDDLLYDAFIGFAAILRLQLMKLNKFDSYQRYNVSKFEPN